MIQIRMGKTDANVRTIKELTKICIKSANKGERGTKLVLTIKKYLNNRKLDPTKIFKLLAETTPIQRETNPCNNKKVQESLQQMCLLGCFYEHGIGTPPNPSMAFRAYKTAADRNDPFAQASLGNCYLDGTGVEINEHAAFLLYKKSSELGNIRGHCNLGHCYLNGFGTNKDINEAVKLFKLAALSGNAVSQYNLGLCYDYGWGVEIDAKTAIHWYKISARNG
ncbi:10918_t:CDS:1 [Ambispora leptoticha]|uniref:10918_t:CDS:1 n=1 Tax=Ambispora leptoticha TaxID=144679 RepID=A0A9N9HW80_9GLOM|nr:10918_t:CDS:1 [Ambispora leptoticha]